MACEWIKSCPLRIFENEGRISNKWKEKYCDTEANWNNCRRFKLDKKNEQHSEYLLPDGSML